MAASPSEALAGRRATYQDVLDAPAHRVAEIVEGIRPGEWALIASAKDDDPISIPRPTYERRPPSYCPTEDRLIIDACLRSRAQPVRDRDPLRRRGRVQPAPRSG